MTAKAATQQDSFSSLDKSLQRLRQHIPDLPIGDIRLARILLDLGRILSARLDAVLAEHKLNEMELRTLAMIYANDDRTVHPSELCTVTSQTRGNMTRTCDALVHRGLLARVTDPHDRRCIQLHITGTGRLFVQDVLPTLYPILQTLVQHVATAERSTLETQLRSIAKTLQVRPAHECPQ